MRGKPGKPDQPPTTHACRLANRRKPFETLSELGPAQKKQLQLLATNNDAGPVKKLVDDDDWNPMELFDIVDAESGKVTHQLYVWPGGSGRVYRNDSTEAVGSIIQHAYEATAGDLPFRKMLAAACAKEKRSLAASIDFRLGFEARAQGGYDAARKALWHALPASSEGMRLFEDFSPAERAIIVAFIEALPDDQSPGLLQFGLPDARWLRRWAGKEPGGALELSIDRISFMNFRNSDSSPVDDERTRMV